MNEDKQITSRRYRIDNIDDINEIDRIFNIPTELFTNPLYKNLSCDAKMVYSIIKHHREIKLDPTTKYLMELLCMSKQKIVAAFNELKEAALIAELED